MPSSWKIIVLLSLSAFLCQAMASESDEDAWDPEDLDEIRRHYRTMPKFRLALEAGFTQWIGGWDKGKTTEEGRKYLERMNRGYNLAMEPAFFLTPRGALGISVLGAFNDISQKDLILNPKSTESYDFSDKIHFFYIGPTAWGRTALGRKGTIYAGFGGGFLSFEDDSQIGPYPYLVEVETYGFMASLGWDFAWRRWLELGINAKVVIGNVTKIRINGVVYDLSKDNTDEIRYHFPLHRFDLNLGIRFCL